MGISYNFIRFLLSEKIDIQPAFFTIFRESNTTSDRFVIALHVQVMADIGMRKASVASVAVLRQEVLKLGPEFCAPSPQSPK